MLEDGVNCCVFSKRLGTKFKKSSGAAAFGNDFSLLSPIRDACEAPKDQKELPGVTLLSPARLSPSRRLVPR
jgi:hypothetical protein